MASTLAGTGAAGADNGAGNIATFDLPEGVAVDGAGNVYVADNGNDLIRKITPDGVVSTLAGNGQAGSANGTGIAASFNSPFGVAVDGTGNVYVADAGNNLIRKISPTGAVNTFAGSGAKGAKDGTGLAATFNTPAGVAVDAAGNVYVADENNNLIRKITTGGIVATIVITPSKAILKLHN
jgi:streptogramin lyase